MAFFVILSVRLVSFVISSFRVASFRYFVCSPGVISSFRLACFVILSFRLASFRYFVSPPGLISSFRLALWRLAKRRNNEMAQTSYHTRPIRVGGRDEDTLIFYIHRLDLSWGSKF